MEAPDTSATSESRLRYWLRCLRPLLWWLLLVLFLYGLHQMQELIRNTSLTFSVLMDGQPLNFGASTKVDGVEVMSGQHIAAGWHAVVVSHRNADPYSTNLLILGKCDLGEINLSRYKGILAVSFAPAAGMLTVTGPEFTRTFTNSSGMTSSVPTDLYFVEARYPNWDKSWQVMVNRDLITALPIVAPLGSARIRCNRDGASFQLLSAPDGRLVQWGQLPARAEGLPEGDYTVFMDLHGDKREKAIRITAGTTNDIQIEYMYGAATLTTEPTGATVRSSDGRDWGVTPLTLSELKPGHWDFSLERQGYESGIASLEIKADETNAVHVTLASQPYSSEMKTARQDIASGNFEWAEQAAKQALDAVPGDADASALFREASARQQISNAEGHVREGNLTVAKYELASAMIVLPDDARAEEVLAELKTGEQDQAEKEHQTHLAQARQAFDTAAAYARNEGQPLGEHELTANMTASDVEAALLKAFNKATNNFKVISMKLTFPDAFAFTAWEKVPGGARHCIVGGAQTGEKETKLYFRVVELRQVPDLRIQSVINGTVNVNFVALDPSFRGELSDAEKKRIQEGSLVVAQLIQRAINSGLQGN